MAMKDSINAAMVFYLVLLLSFLVLSESVSFPGNGFFGRKATPECDSVYGVADGDTCFSVAQQFNLTAEFFDSINPNLNCDKLFDGQWLCVDGSAN